MKINKGLLAGLVAGAAVFAVSSCAYDPYDSGTSASTSYGHGYGSSGFSTSVFVSTGNPRWGYDPYAGAYYDYTRRAYYDPYLYGYYPIGYRPQYVYGSPHPGGWVRGRSYCPPPRTIRSHTLTNYSNRPHSYRSLGKDWSRNVRVTAPADNPRQGYGGRNMRQQGFQGSHEPTYPQRQESVPSRSGSFQMGGEDRSRGSFGRGASGGRGVAPENTRLTVPQPTARTDDEFRSDFSGSQSPLRMERTVPEQRFERPEPQQRMERPLQQRQPEARPESPRGEWNRGGNPPRGGETRGRGIRGLGEG